MFGLFLCMSYIIYRILPNTRAPPQIDAPPQFFDHVGLPEDTSPKIYMTTLFDDQFNAVFVAYKIIQMYTKNSALAQLITVTVPKSQVAILFQRVEYA